MANYQKTQELFNGEPNREPGLKYEKSGEQLSEEKWFEQVKNPNHLISINRLLKQQKMYGLGQMAQRM
jgi:hypothetical protein